MKAAATSAIQKAERILGMCARDSAREIRNRFRDLAALAQARMYRAVGRDEDGSAGSESEESKESDFAEHQG